MNLLEEIQTAAVDAGSDLSTILRKCKLLVARLGSQPLEDWLLWESNGYSNSAAVPEYRAWSLQVKGHFFGPYGSRFENAPIPMVCIPKDVRKSYREYKCRQSIASVESILASGTDRMIQISTGNLALSLGMNVYKGQNCVQAWAEFGRAHLVEVTNAVRNRILDFVIAVWKEAPHAGEPANVQGANSIEVQRVTQIFNTTVYGGSANLVGTATSSSIEFNIFAGNIAALRSVLESNGVDAADLRALEIALVEEPRVVPGGGYGPKVAEWVSKMMGKATSGAWNVGLGAAGSLLASALAKYYGIG